MSIERQYCIRTFKILRNGDYPVVPEQCVESLLRWLCGGQHGSSESARLILGDPMTESHLVERVYQALDAKLFTNDVALRPIKGTVSEKERRYRLLVRAFHPDRFPELGRWLTRRSQAVNADYAEFRNNPNAHEAPEESVEITVNAPVFRSQVARARRPSIGEWIVRITAPLSRSHHAQKTIILAATILCTLLFMIIYHTNRMT